MKTKKKTKLGVLFATLLSLPPTASNASKDQAPQDQFEQEQAQKQTFTPLEELDPQLRGQILDKIQIISTFVEIEWDTVIIGINEKGQIVFKEINSIDMTPLRNPTCWVW